MSSQYAEGSLDGDRVDDYRQILCLPVLLMPSPCRLVAVKGQSARLSLCN